MAKRVAEIFVETLVNAGVRRIYGVVGDSLNGLTDVIRRSKIEWLHVRHEEVAAFAAGAEAHLSGEITVCAKLAESAEIFGVRVEKPEELRPALSQALAHNGPALVEVLVNRQELSMPPTISLEQALGFSLYMIRTVLSGRGDEVIDLAMTNLIR